MPSTAPLPPGDVSAVLVTPVTLLVRWTIPHVSDGTLMYFTVYAFPLTQRSKRQTSTILGTISKVNFLKVLE